MPWCSLSLAAPPLGSSFPSPDLTFLRCKMQSTSVSPPRRPRGEDFAGATWRTCSAEARNVVSKDPRHPPGHLQSRSLPGRPRQSEASTPPSPPPHPRGPRLSLSLLSLEVEGGVSRSVSTRGLAQMSGGLGSEVPSPGVSLNSQSRAAVRFVWFFFLPP